MSKHLVIIGGLATGMKTAAKASREDKNLKITVFQEEDFISYARCALPMYISGLIKNKNELIIKTPEEINQNPNIDVKTQHRVTRINTTDKTVEVLNLITNDTFIYPYDDLVIATGSRPIIPDIEGVDSKNVFVLKTLEDADKIKTAAKKAKNAVIIGTGFIGVELAEALKLLNLNVSMISESPHILLNYDEDVAIHIEKFLRDKGIQVHSGEKIIKLESDYDGNVKKVISDKKVYDADIVLLAKGTQPVVDIVRDAGIEIGQTGAIKVNEFFETTMKNIYAGGDCIEVFSLVGGTPVKNNSGSLANLHGNYIAQNICGTRITYNGSLNSQIVKIFELTLAKSGLSEKEAQKAGIEYEVVIVPGWDKTEYYPDVEQLVIKMLADKASHKILGVQIFGAGNVTRRIDIAATAMTAGFTTEKLGQTDLCYAPPYTGPIDILAHAANVLTNKLTGQMVSITPMQFKERMEKDPESYTLIDVRPPDVFASGHLPGSLNIPFSELDNHLEELKGKKEVIFNCNIGKTTYNAYRKATNNNLQNTKCLEGGVSAWIGELDTSK
jgi:NADPH-dependent 2,4-dienoyl-CoA reductase/sulfur reductase-like enzyme/rhodanese-related sulfurtransferase